MTIPNFIAISVRVCHDNISQISFVAQSILHAQYNEMTAFRNDTTIITTSMIIIAQNIHIIERNATIRSFLYLYS